MQKNFSLRYPLPKEHAYKYAYMHYYIMVPTNLTDGNQTVVGISKRVRYKFGNNCKKTKSANTGNYANRAIVSCLLFNCLTGYKVVICCHPVVSLLSNTGIGTKSAKATRLSVPKNHIHIFDECTKWTQTTKKKIT